VAFTVRFAPDGDRCADIAHGPLSADIVEELGDSAIRIRQSHFDRLSGTTILRRVSYRGPGYAAIAPIRALAGLNLASRRKGIDKLSE
jgi:hypothetical protein